MSTRSAKPMFIKPFGQFKYLRAPYGISSISEHYNRRMTEAFNRLSGFRRVVDDFVIYDSNLSDYIAHAKQFLKRADQRIALNAEKCRFFQTKATFYCLIKATRLTLQSQMPLQDILFQLPYRAMLLCWLVDQVPIQLHL